MQKGLYEHLIDFADDLDDIIGLAVEHRKNCLDDGYEVEAAMWAGRFRAHLEDL